MAPRTYRASCPGRTAQVGLTLLVARSYARSWGPGASVMCEQTLDVATTDVELAASLRRRINRMGAELEHIVAEYEGSDRQDAELGAAARRVKRNIIEAEAELTAIAVAEVA